MTSVALQQSTAFFELLPGKVLDIQVNHPVTVRQKASLVGYEIGKYIILKHPAPDRMKSFKDVFAEGNVMIVRYLIEGTHGQCFAFKTTIRHVTQFPEKFIILDYPEHIENRQLRKHQRFTTYLPAQIISAENGEPNEASSLAGVIGDISAQGCGFTFRSENPKIKVNRKDIFVRIMMSEGRKISIPAKVCNSRFESGKVNVGIKFEDNDLQVNEILQNLFIDAEL